MSTSLANHLVSSASIPQIRAALESIKSAAGIDDVLSAFAAKPSVEGDSLRGLRSSSSEGGSESESELMQLSPRTEKYFSFESMEQIMHALQHCDSGDADAEWCAGVAEQLQGKSPTSLKICHRLLREGVHMDLKTCLEMDFRLMINCLFEIKSK